MSFDKINYKRLAGYLYNKPASEIEVTSAAKACSRETLYRISDSGSVVTQSMIGYRHRSLHDHILGESCCVLRYLIEEEWAGGAMSLARKLEAHIKALTELTWAASFKGDTAKAREAIEEEVRNLIADETEVRIKRFTNLAEQRAKVGADEL